MSDTPTSLITAPRLAVAVAALLSIAVPLSLLNGNAPSADISLDGRVTPFDMVAIEPLAEASTSPLFNPSRSAPAAEDAVDGNMSVAEAASPAAVPALVGLIVGRGTPGVALIRGADGQTKLLRRGETVDGWQLTTLSTTTATFEMGGQTEQVGLDFRNRTDSGQAAPPSSSPTAPSSPSGQ